jgi:ABC-2 type transport system ATP-binding protein
MIEIRNIKKRYADGTLALRGINLNLKKRTTAVLGRNGAGKTTLLRILSTQLLPTSGHATINGYDVVKDAEKLRRMMVSIPQEAGPIGYITPEEHLAIYLSARRMPSSEIKKESVRVLKDLGMWDARGKTADDLSGGMKRKIFVGMALAANADIIFLDEPTLGLDPISRIEVWSALKKLKSTIVLTTHYIDEAKELTEEIVLVEDGRVRAHGEIDKLLKRAAGMVRVESALGKKGKYHIGGLSISYVKAKDSDKYLEQGYIVKQISLEDLFIMKGEKINFEEETDEY